MAKTKRVLSLFVVALMTVFTVLSYVPAKAATAAPKLSVVTQPAAEYTPDQTISFTVNAHYAGKVMYRVILYNGTTKLTSNLWNTPKTGYYYTKWTPSGTMNFNIHWAAKQLQPGYYSMTVLAKKVGSKAKYDTYVDTHSFLIKNEEATISSIADVTATVDEGGAYTLPATVSAKMSDDTTKDVAVVWTPATVDTTKVGDQPFTGKVEGYDKDVKLTLTVKAVPLAVTSVSAINLKEIQIKFNKKVDASTATNVNNYKLNDAILPVTTSATLLDDGATVVINLRDYTTLVNQKNYKLGVSIGTLSTTVDFTPLDVTVPTVKSVEALGSKKINITFSEPVDPNTALTRINYQINGYVINGELSQNKDKNVITVSLYSSLKAGENKITVTGVKDFAGMTIVNYLNQSFTVVDDSTAPASFTVNSATLEYVDVTFNEAIDPNSVDASNIYWSDNAGTTKHYATDAYPLDSTYTKYEFDFTGDRLPAKSTTLYVEDVSDMSENEAAKLTSVVTANVDIERPDVLSVDFMKDPNTGLYVTGNNVLEVKFNKTIELSQFTGDNVTNLMVKDSNGKVVAVAANAAYKVINGIEYKDTIWVTLTSALTDEKTYTVAIANVVDNTALQNKMIPETFTLVGLAQTAPTVENAYVYTDANNSTKIQIIFSNSMSISGDKSILDNGKYMMQIGSKWYPIPSTATFEPTYNNMAVIITIPAEAKYDTTNYVKDVTISKVKVTYVADKNGNMLADYTQELSPAIDTGATMITNADADYYPYASAKDTIVVTFDRPLQYVNYKDFIVGDGTYTVTKATYQTVDGKGVVTLKISSDTPLPAAANTVTVKTLSDLANIKSLDILGNKIAVNTTGVAVVDEIAPSLIATDPVVATANNAITVYTNEPLQMAPNSTDVSASFIVTYGYNNKALTPGSDYSAVVNGNNVVITLKNTSLQNLVNLKVATNDNIKLVYDKAVDGDITNSNALSFTAKTVKYMNIVDTKAPTADATTPVSVTHTAGSTNLIAGEKVAFKFSEPLSTTSQTDVISAIKTALGDTKVTVATSDGITFTATVLTSQTIDATNAITVSIDATKVIDVAGNAAGATGNVTFTIPAQK